MRAGEGWNAAHATAPAGAKRITVSKYCQYTSPRVAWCSATLSTRGLPVCVCGTNKPRTRAESPPTSPEASSATSEASAATPPKSATRLRNAA